MSRAARAAARAGRRVGVGGPDSARRPDLRGGGLTLKGHGRDLTLKGLIARGLIGCGGDRRTAGGG